jgi:hypothetical protein
MLSDDSRGYTGDRDVGWRILGHDSARPYGGPATDLKIRKDDRTGSHEDALSDVDAA